VQADRVGDHGWQRRLPGPRRLTPDQGVDVPEQIVSVLDAFEDLSPTPGPLDRLLVVRVQRGSQVPEVVMDLGPLPKIERGPSDVIDRWQCPHGVSPGADCVGGAHVDVTRGDVAAIVPGGCYRVWPTARSQRLHRPSTHPRRPNGGSRKAARHPVLGSSPGPRLVTPSSAPRPDLGSSPGPRSSPTPAGVLGSHGDASTTNRYRIGVDATARGMRRGGVGAAGSTDGGLACDGAGTGAPAVVVSPWCRRAPVAPAGTPPALRRCRPGR
jgi:hypothetical protein